MSDPSDRRPEPRPERHTVLMMDMERSGDWEVPARLELRGTRSHFRLDLTEATYAAPEVVIDLALYAGSATITVGADVEVVVATTRFAVPEAPPTSPADGSEPQVVLVSGYARLGSRVRLVRQPTAAG